MGRKNTNGITDHESSFHKVDKVQVRKRLLELTKMYNPSFNSEELDNIIENGTIDYFLSATNSEPSGVLAKSDAKLMNELYNVLRHKESVESLGSLLKNNKSNPHEVIKLMKKGGDISDLPMDKVSILFLDIKGSSSLWAKGEEKMFKALGILDEVMAHIIANNNGMIVKTIGDAFMCSYTGKDSLMNAVKSAYEIQNRLINKPIPVGKNRLSARIGICYGDIYVKDSEIQGKKLKDYFGNAVNTASRMESKVSSVDGFAFSFLDNVSDEGKILNFLKDKGIFIDVIQYDYDCPKEDGKKRSGRLLTDLQIKECKDLAELNGVSSVRVYKCELPKASGKITKYMETGGDVHLDKGMVKKNEEIGLLLAKKGLDREKYSEMELQTITHYSYPTRLMNELVNKMWGLAKKHGFGGFGDKKIQVFNSGNGEILRFIPDSVHSVEVYEKDSDLYMISSLLFASDKVNIHKRLRTMKNTYDISIGVCSNVSTIVNPDIINYIKKDGLMIAVVNSDLFEQNFENERSILNDNFTLLEAFRLPSDVMDGYDLIALKKN